MIRVHLKLELRQCCDECGRDRELSDARTKRVAPECTLDDGAGRHIKVGRHVLLRPPPISLVYIIIQQSLLV